ncbi:MAG: hypothetical protein JXA06_03690, partial [Bacteroidetes bacterium]|nr:hypothetical protein [Bacteroidota bacterium]
MNDITTTICLLAGIQGVLLTVVLAVRRQNHTANKILAVATFILSIDMLFAVYYTKGIFREYPHLMGISYPFPLVYGPIFYLYAKVLSKKAEKLVKKDLLHFLPVVIIYIFCIPEFLYTAGQKIIFVENIMQNIHSPKFTVFENIIPIQGLLYTFFTIRLVGEYDKKIRDEYSNIDRINLNWLKYIAFAGLIIWILVALVFYAAPMKKYEILIEICLSIMIYSIGYMGLKQPEIFINKNEKIDASEAVQSEKYKRSGLNEKLAEEIAKRLKDYMEAEKPYLDNDLTMQKLA